MGKAFDERIVLRYELRMRLSCFNLAVAALLALVPLSLTAGEKIKFSGRTGANEAEKELELQKTFIAPNFLPVKTEQPGQDLMFMPRTQGSNTRPTKKQLAEQERERNWIFQKTDDKKESDKDKEKDSEEKEDSEEQPPRNSIERFLIENSSGRQNTGRQGTNSVNNSRIRDEREMPAFLGGGGSTNGIGGRASRSDGLGGAADYGPVNGNAPTFGSSRTERLFQPVEGESENRRIGGSGNGLTTISPNDPRMDEFRKLLAPTPISSGASLGPDLTSKEINPLTGRGLGGGDREGSTFDLLNSFGGGANDAARRMFEPLSPGNSFAPVGDASRSAPKPVVLDLPKRNF